MRSRLLLIALLALQGVLAVLRHGPDSRFGGDEPYYVEKARTIARLGALPRASARDLAIERGEIKGVGDWRPPGYPLLVAICSLGNFEPLALHRRVTVMQLLALAAALWWLFETLMRFVPAGSSAGFGLAVLLGALPWPFEFVGLVGPDSLNASCCLIAVLLLWREQFFAGSLVAALCMFLRPDMLALTPLLIAAAWLVSSRRRSDAFRCAAAFLLVLGLQFGYRAYFTRTLTPDPFGGFNLADRGAYDWAHSWLGTEREGYDFVYGLTNGRLTANLPDRAFANDGERRTVMELVERVRREGYSQEIDAAFARLTAERLRADPLRANIAPRLWHTAHLWLNDETNEQLLVALAHMPRWPRRILIGALLVTKFALLLGFAVAVWKFSGRDPLGRLIVLMAVVVIARTLVIGVALNWMVHRYVLVAWPHILGCVAAAYLARNSRRSIA